MRVAIIARALMGLRPLRVNGDSMAPWLAAGSWRLAVMGGFRARKPQRGDVALVRVGSELLVKRVVGLPGETLAMRGAGLFVQGRALGHGFSGGAESESHAWELGTDEYAVLGDNRARSTDSRHWGKVRRHQLEGRVLGAGRRLRTRTRQ